MNCLFTVNSFMRFYLFFWIFLIEYHLSGRSSVWQEHWHGVPRVAGSSPVAPIMRNGNKNFRYQTIVFSLIFFFLTLLSLKSIYSYNTSATQIIGKNWKLVTEAKLGKIQNFTAKGKWVVWNEIKGDSNAPPFLARTKGGSLYYFGIYRKNIDSNTTTL